MLTKISEYRFQRHSGPSTPFWLQTSEAYAWHMYESWQTLKNLHIMPEAIGATLTITDQQPCGSPKTHKMKTYSLRLIKSHFLTHLKQILPCLWQQMQVLPDVMWFDQSGVIKQKLSPVKTRTSGLTHFKIRDSWGQLLTPSHYAGEYQGTSFSVYYFQKS